jgi:hypothetical protein
MDALKYLLSHLPEPAELVIPKSKIPKPWMFWHEEDDNGKMRRMRG